MAQLINRNFFARPATTVAPELLGWELIYSTPAGDIGGIIVETEAYMGAEDAASHAFRGPTARTAVMFGPPGHAYIYFTYGMHYCFNVVTSAEGTASAVLIRALEPARGLELMKANRRVEHLTQLTNGPAKLTQALGLDRALNGHDLLTPPLQLFPAQAKIEFASSPRIGIRHATTKPWRYYIPNHGHLSQPTPKNPT